MISPPIFKRDTQGRVRTWQFEVEGDRWRTHAGLEDGVKTTTGWTVCTPKSRGTAEEQALFEAMAEQKKKLDRDYHEHISQIDKPKYFKPMLAETYAGGLVFNHGVVFTQPKLDGVRCIATRAGLFSRQGKQFFNADHILASLAPMFDRNPNLILDGELYNHDLADDFNQITSLVRKQKPKPAEREKAAELIQYHVYDAPDPEKDFSNRLVSLTSLEFDPAVVKLVETYAVGSDDELDLYYSRWLAQSYEGQMVRLNGPYQQQRSRFLLKRKEFVSDEFPVVRVEEGLGNWAGYAKGVVLSLPDGREFGAGVKGNQAFTKELLTRPVKVATIRYFHLTPDGVPRFPVAVDFDRKD